MTLARVCYDCGARTSEPVARCECGEPLWLDTDPHGFDWNHVTEKAGMWRYESLLPVSAPGGLADAAGDTPLLRTTGLDAYAGARIHVKVEGEHPTGSFKDRGSALGVAAIAADRSGDEATDENGAGRAVGTVSHGNMAMSTAAYAAEANLPCVVLVPDDIPAERLGIIAQYEPTLLRVAGDYGELYERALALGREHEITFLNSDVPLRVEGQKTTAIEICEAFDPEVPDAIVMPVSSGGHASGAWKALRELEAAGAIDEIPPLYFVQAAACAPIAEAFEAGAEEVTSVEGGETIAYSIANADPPSGTRALRAARETGGAVLAVDDDEIRTAKRALATQAGLSVEASSAVPLAGVRQLTADGELTADDDVAVIATGTGLKETAGAADVETIDMVDLDGRLSGLKE